MTASALTEDQELTNISVRLHIYLLELADIWVLEPFHNTDFAQKGLMLGRSIPVSICIRPGCVRLFVLDHLDGNPFSGGEMNGFHHGGEGTLAEFITQVVILV